MHKSAGSLDQQEYTHTEPHITPQMSDQLSHMQALGKIPLHEAMDVL